MNYRHAFHAGNHADVLKHATLARVLAHMLEKPKPFLFLDTHAGIARYDLQADEAQKTGEAENGIGKLWDLSPEPPALLRRTGASAERGRGDGRSAERGSCFRSGTPSLPYRYKDAERTPFLRAPPRGSPASAGTGARPAGSSR